MSLIAAIFLIISHSPTGFAKSCQEPVPNTKVADKPPTRNISADQNLSASAILTHVHQGSLISEQKTQKLSKEFSAEIVIDIDPEKHYQEIWGFGATITHACLENMKSLSKIERTEFLEKLFSAEKGAGFNFLRLPVGGNDYSNSNYTLADTPKNKKGEYTKDPKLKYYSFKKDQAYADFAKEIKKINPNLKIMISPWTPPAWMKLNKSLLGGIVNPEAYDAYARYLIKTLEAYKKQGIEVPYMSLMNEPTIGWAKEHWNFAQAYMDVSEQQKFLSSNFSPMLKARSDLKTKVLLLDHNWEHLELASDLMKDKNIKDISAGVATHCYGGNSAQIKNFIEQNPRTPVMQTECTASFNQDPAGQSFRWWLENQSVDAIRYGAAGALGWNICLDQKGEPRNNGCVGCRGMVTIDQSNPKKPQVTYNEEYFALAQTSKYLQRGAVKIASTDSKENGVINVAFLNLDGSRVVVMRNTKKEPIKVSVRDDDCQASTSLIPAEGALTLKWLPAQQSISPANKMSRIRKINRGVASKPTKP